MDTEKRKLRVYLRTMNRGFKRYISRDYEESARTVLIEISFASALAITLLLVVSRMPA